MGRYTEIIESCKENKKFGKYHKQGLTLMLILLYLSVNIVERQVTISERKQSVISQNFEVCISSVCLGSDTDDVAECLSLIDPMLTNVSIVNERYARIKGVKRIVITPLSECQ